MRLGAGPYWGTGVYAISTTPSIDDVTPCLPEAPIDPAALNSWLRVCPHFLLDGRSPTVDVLADRLQSWWLPDETVIYLGMAGSSLRTRVSNCYRTPLGARRPHAGGHWLKTLSDLDGLLVYWAPTSEPEPSELGLLAAFADRVSGSTRAALPNSAFPIPWANLEWGKGRRKDRGFRNTRSNNL